MRLALNARHVQLGRAEAGGQRVEHGVCVGRAAQDFKHARAGVGAVIKAVPAVFKENMAAHFAAQRRANLAHLGLDERVAGLVHQRHAASILNFRRQALRAFHVKNNGLARLAPQHVARKQHHLAVGKNVLAVLGDDAQAVAVAVKGQAKFGVAGLQRLDQVLQILGLARVGMVVGKVAVHFAEQLSHLAAQRPEHRWRRGAGHAVARVNDDFHRPLQLQIRDDALDVVFLHIGLADRAVLLGRGPAFGLYGLLERLNFFAVNGAAGQHHLEAVVVFGVVAAGHLNARGGQRVGREIQHGRGDHAHVHHVNAGFYQTVNQGRAQGLAAESAVAPHGHEGFALFQRGRAKGLAQRLGHCLVDGGRHHAANVVSLENGCCNLHCEYSFFKVRLASSLPQWEKVQSRRRILCTTPGAHPEAWAVRHGFCLEDPLGHRGKAPCTGWPPRPMRSFAPCRAASAGANFRAGARS